MTIERSMLFRVSLSLLAVLPMTGCIRTIGAAIGSGVDCCVSALDFRYYSIKHAGVEGEVTQITVRDNADTLRGRFRGLKPLTQVMLSLPLPLPSTSNLQPSTFQPATHPITCEILLPKDWNGRLWALGCEEAGGDVVGYAPYFTKNGAAVVSCDGGTGYVRNRNRTTNPLKAGARSDAVRKAFACGAVREALEAACKIVTSYYDRAPEKVCFYGRGTGGAQGLQLAATSPEALDALVVVNPATDFAALAQYDLQLEQAFRSEAGGRIIRPSQCDAIAYAADSLKLEAYDPAREGELFDMAAKVDGAFSTASRYGRSAARTCWHKLFTMNPPVTLRTDIHERINARPWRLAWMFGEKEEGLTVSAKDVEKKAPDFAFFDAPTDLSAFLSRGKLHLVIEQKNAFVPAPIVESYAKRLAPGLSIERIDGPYELSAALSLP